jgi:hypothetical protein
LGGAGHIINLMEAPPMIAESMFKLALVQIFGVEQETADKITSLGGLTKGVVGLLQKHFADPTGKLPKALHRSNQRAWKTLELALSGDGWLTKLQRWFARGEDKAVAHQIRAFLEVQCLRELKGQPAEVRQYCLEDLCAAREKKVLENEVDANKVLRLAEKWKAEADPAARLQDDLQAVSQMSRFLYDQGYQHLGWLLGLQVREGSSVLVTAVRYYFRREVETDQQLFQGLTFSKLDQINREQVEGFTQVTDLLGKHGAQLADLLGYQLETLDEVRRSRKSSEAVLHEMQKTRTDVERWSQDARTILVNVENLLRENRDVLDEGLKENKQAMLDLREEMGRQMAAMSEQHRAQCEEFYKPVLAMLEKLQLQSRPIRATDSMSIRSDHERAEVEQLVRQYRKLSPAERRRFPALLNGLGQLEFAVNDFEGAQKTFAEAAEIAPDTRAQALAHFNAFRAALERQPRRFDEALKELLEAVRLDRDSFALFPHDKYEPLRILGAGGFGVTILCRHTKSNAQVAIKAITTDGLGRDVSTVFREAMTLEELHHTCLIRLRDCDFADAAERRPYLIMEYFPGTTLEDHVKTHGPLQGNDFLAVARKVADALAAAHGKNILHRDIKPANLLVRQDGNDWHVCVIDFGLALKQKVLSGASTSSLRHSRTVSGTSIAGTIDYAAPEQMGKLPDVAVGPPADVYGFGKTCYFMLLQTPEPDDREKKRLSEPLRDLLGWCTARLPNNRPQTFRDVLNALDAVAGKSVPVAIAVPVSPRPGAPATPVPTVTPVPPRKQITPPVVLKPVPPPVPPQPKPVPPVVLKPAPEPARGRPHPEPVEGIPLDEVPPVALPPVAPPADVVTVWLVCNPDTPDMLSRFARSARKVGVFFDDKFVGEGDDWYGFKLRLEASPGDHTITLKSRERVRENRGWVEVPVSRAFAVNFPEVGRFDVFFSLGDKMPFRSIGAKVIRRS